MSASGARSELIALGFEELARGEAWARLERRVVSRTFDRGAVLWTTGSPSVGLYVVLGGRVRIVRGSRGRQHLVHVAVRGDTMGEIPVLDGMGYPATAIVAERSECLILAPDDVLDLVESDGRAARFLLDRLARRVRLLVERLESQTLGDVRSRVAGSLVGLSVEQESATVALPSPQAAWAEDLGTVRETLSREVARLARDGLIERAGRGRVRIVDEVGLERAALRR